jgi:two-component system response regulator HydG
MLAGNGMGMLVGRSSVMGKLYRILSKVAFTTHPVLIFGEAGTGKELVARSIHSNGPTATKPFIPIDCGSLVPSLIERELFGYVKGAFPEATQSNIGLLAAADGGTVFLDEIADLPLSLQARLLRALQEKQVRPIGGTQSTPISVRVLAATNRDLAAMVQNGRFRKDLFYRLNVVNIRIPPLRDRKGDILLLAENALERLRSESAVPFTLTHDAIRHLTEYDWPGNVRELEHALEHACALSSGPVLRTVDFPAPIQASFPVTNTSPDDGRDTVSQPYSQEVISIAELEKQAILRTIDQLNGDKLTAARLLGIGKTTLYRKLKEYGLETRNGSSPDLESSTPDEK